MKNPDKKDDRPERPIFFVETCLEEKEEKSTLYAEVNFGEKENKSSSGEFVVDSGCNSHLVKDKSLLCDIRKAEEPIIFKVAKQGGKMAGEIVGSVKGELIELSNVTFLPELTRNLMSVHAITENGGEVHFSKKEVTITKEKQIIMRGYKNSNGLYIIDVEKEKEVLAAYEEKLLWHRKLGHMNFNNMKKIGRLCDGLPENFAKLHSDTTCEVCIMAKHVRNPFSTVRYKATRPLEIVHSDLCGKLVHLPFGVRTTYW